MNIAQRVERAKRSTYNYFLYINEKAAEEIEALKRVGRCGKLCGVLLAVKDNIEVAGMPITNGAPYMQKIAENTAPAVSMFLAEGAVVLG
ncbi:MAG: amidase family protein, partial [Pyrobaculum sp.]